MSATCLRLTIRLGTPAAQERNVKSGLGHVPTLEPGVDEVRSTQTTRNGLSARKIGFPTRSIWGSHKTPKCPVCSPYLYTLRMTPIQDQYYIAIVLQCGFCLLSKLCHCFLFFLCSLGSSLNLYLDFCPWPLVSASALTWGFYHRTLCPSYQCFLTLVDSLSGDLIPPLASSWVLPESSICLLEWTW